MLQYLYDGCCNTYMMGESLHPQVHFDGRLADVCKENECTAHYCVLLRIIVQIIACKKQARVKVCQVTKQKTKIIQRVSKDGSIQPVRSFALE